ncbi:hypothetical protein AAH991_29800 [Microbispora sp. ZYX-F-249]|uniref:Uncharacterized protein n=1 Tax=Microbispora maris TaxID=3144104 RepID=A0ABV0B078_9ACTN
MSGFFVNDLMLMLCIFAAGLLIGMVVQGVRCSAALGWMDTRLARERGKTWRCKQELRACCQAQSLKE